MRIIQKILSEEPVLCSSPRSVNEFEVEHNPIINIRYNDLAPDSLFKLIESFQWTEALAALNESVTHIYAPKYETRQWVTKNEVLKSSWRRLPIHEACIRQPNAAVIAALLDAYPDSATLQDNLGRTPLHHAIIHHADIKVIYLLLDAHFNGTEDTDFWKKTPRQYAEEDEFYTSSATDVIDAMKPNVDYASIADAASKVRKHICASPSHVINVNFNTPESQTNKSRSSAVVDLLEEELAQARVEADTAYAQRDVAMENELLLKHQVEELREILTIRQDEAKELQELSERNRQISYLLRQLEEKQAAQDKVVAQKEKEIAKLRRRVEAQKKNKGDKIDKATKKAQYEKQILVSTVTSLTQKIQEMEKNRSMISNSPCNLSIISGNGSESPSPDCGEVMVNLSADKSEKTAMTTTMETEAAMETEAEMEKLRRDLSCSEKTIMKMEDDLVVSENEKINLEKKLDESNALNAKLEKDVGDTKKRNEVAMEMICALEDALELYQTKVARLEDGFYQVTDQLICVSRNLPNSQSSVGPVKRSASFRY